MKRLFAVLCMVLLSSCSTHFSTAKVKGQRDRVIYNISKEQAFSIARSSFETIVAPEKIKDIKGRHRGYTAYYTNPRGQLIRFQLVVVPARGVTRDRTRVEGFYFRVISGGTYADGSKLSKQLYETLQARLQATDSAINVVRLRRKRSMENKYLMAAKAGGAEASRPDPRDRRGQVESAPDRPVTGSADRMEAPTASAPPTGKSDALRRMEILKEMHDRGFISDEDYGKKKAEILKAL